jgi:hypothetical protein
MPPPPLQNNPGVQAGAKALLEEGSRRLVEDVRTGPRGWGSRTMWASIAFSAACTATAFATGQATPELLGVCFAPLTAWIVGEKYNDAAHAKR